MEKFKEFQDCFISYFQTLSNILKGKSGNELIDNLTKQAISEEQKRVIQDICQEIDTEHNMLEEMVCSKKSPGEFLKQDIVEAVTTIRPESTNEEIQQVIDAALNAIEKEIKQEAENLNDEI